ncbi:hypothetical protein BKA62DRAFT_443665 [Auriculariales sp. MPI-PUGE-AT-0066]|nr:hypothetical protein BKA62DRAFT_443665 [Auriculariales sp. MPI-PUGE-AT-0066]
MFMALDGMLGNDEQRGDQGQPVNSSNQNSLTRGTLKAYATVLFACWRRYGRQTVPKGVSKAVKEFIDSERFHTLGKPSTKMREKLVATLEDLALVVHNIYVNRAIRRTTAGKVQLAYLTNLLAYTGSRPGAIIESSSYRGTNQALTYGDHRLYAVPIDDNQPNLGRFLMLVIKFRLLKGYRNDDSSFLELVLYLEDDDKRLICPVWHFIAVATTAGAINIPNWHDVFHPDPMPPKAQLIGIQPGFAEKPVFCKEVLAGGVWTMSLDQAFNHGGLQREYNRASLHMGLRHRLVPYAMRRGAANAMSELPKETREHAQGRLDDSKAYQISYQSRTIDIDLQALFKGTAQDHLRRRNSRMARSVTFGSNNNAPQQLSADEITTLRCDPLLVSMQATEDTLLAKIEAVEEEIAHAEEDEDFEAQLGVLTEKQDGLEDELKLTRSQIRSRVRSLGHKTLQQKVTSFLDKSELTGGLVSESLLTSRTISKALSKHSPLVPFGTIQNRATAIVLPSASGSPATRSPATRNTSEKENLAAETSHGAGAITTVAEHDPSLNIDPGEASPAPEQPDGWQKFVYSLYAKTTEDAPPDSYFSYALNRLLTLPDVIPPQFYPGDCANDDYTCPGEGCKLPLIGDLLAGVHLRQCLHSNMCKDAIAERDATWSGQRRCPWEGCTQATFNNLQDWVEHARRHFGAKKCKFGPRCTFSLKAIGEPACQVHVASAHGINLAVRPDVKYCYICNLSFVDQTGARAEWREHLIMHRQELFIDPLRPFIDAAALGNPLPYDPRYDLLRKGSSDEVLHDHDAGFGGSRPEYHGQFHARMALVPIFCPYCVHDDDLDIEDQLQTYLSTNSFTTHFNNAHLKHLTDTDNRCPDPSCVSLPSLTKHETLNHLVYHHYLPVSGSGKTKKWTSLLVPVESGNHDQEQGDPQVKEKRKKATRRPAPAKKHKNVTNNSSDVEEMSGDDDAMEVDVPQVAQVLLDLSSCATSKPS